MPNASMSHSFFGGPNQSWDPAYWTHTERGQPTSQISQDLQPPLTFDPPVTHYQNDSKDDNQLLGTDFQQSWWNPASWWDPASWDPSLQNTMSPSQQGQSILPSNTYGGASHVAPTAPGLSMTDTISNYLSPEQQMRSFPTQSRQTSAMSNQSFASGLAVFEVCRNASPEPKTPTAYGFRGPDNSWSCAWPGCTSHARFTRACDLRKHFKRHSKTLFCRYDGCPQSREAGFSSKKDRARHETKHNPKITCEWENCGRLFGRVDSMVGLHQHRLSTRAFADYVDLFREITYEGYTALRSYSDGFVDGMLTFEYGCCWLIDARKPQIIDSMAHNRKRSYQVPRLHSFCSIQLTTRLTPRIRRACSTSGDRKNTEQS